MQCILRKCRRETREAIERVGLATLIAGFIGGYAGGVEPLERVSFNRDIRPIFSEICWQCHGPGSHEAGLRLDLRDEAIRETDSGILPIVPGAAEQSEVVARIFAVDEDMRMPPPESDKVLSREQKTLIKQWIAQGAQYEQHWAFAPLHRPKVPEGESHPVDALIEERLKDEGIASAPLADRRTLIRRITLDLTGLPPSPEEVQAFLSDRSPDAYERVVDRLLASPRFAEKQAVHWLDAVRFADTRGFHSDGPFPIWPYRDYVLQAFQDNLPFDVFTREQLAGDMLPDATDMQRVASAFNRLNRTSTEGGIQEKEYLAKYGADRVRTVSAVWLGLTLGCAECHDHKFDPLLQKDFYALKAFFADMRYPSALGGRLELPSDIQQALLKQLGEAEAEAANTLSERTAKLVVQREEWEGSALRDLDAGTLAWEFQRPVSVSADQGAELKVYLDEPIESEFSYEDSNYVRRWPAHGMVVAGGANPDNTTYEVVLRPGAGKWIQLGLEVFNHDPLPGNSLGRGNETFLLSEIEIEISTDGVQAPERIQVIAAIDDGKGGHPIHQSAATVFDGDPDSAWGSPDWVRSLGNRFLAARFAEPLETNDNSLITVRLRHDTQQRQATIGRFRLALSTDPRSFPAATTLPWMVGEKKADIGAGRAPPWRAAGLPETTAVALRTAVEARTEDQQRLALLWFQWSHPDLVQNLMAFQRASIAVDRLRSEVPQCLVSEQADTPTVTRVLPRGNWMDDSGDVVQPAIPEFLGQLKTGELRANRLDLANWLVSNDNPLTPRVLANRAWRQFFSVGLSQVLDDFGSQGAWPTHPDLLDWLACEFRSPKWEASGTHGWDWKHLVRVIVTSRAYRRTSLSTPMLDEQDPNNRWLARQNRPRLDAEMIRDQSLAVSGLLKHRFGGPSVRPYQVEGYYSVLYYPRRGYPTSRGDDLWRRSLYTFWQRTFPHPTLMAFDGCTREEAQVSRSNSNTPQQALVLLNAPEFVEASRELARLALEHEEDVGSRIKYAFLRTLSRPPTHDELKLTRTFYARRLAEYRDRPRDAELLLSIGDSPQSDDLPNAEWAAMTAVTRLILNLHETIIRN